MKHDSDTDRFEKCPRLFSASYPKPATELTLRCRHGIPSGSGCDLCGDVVPPLSGKRPWWTPFWRFWHRWWT